MLKSLLTNVSETLGLAHWLIVRTEEPACTYYFGPFLGEADAEASKAGYIEDLQAENAQGISAEIVQCRRPSALTQ